MSASRTPTRAPWAAQASARFTATVDLPTPPLPEATATMLRISPSGFRLRCTAPLAVDLESDIRAHAVRSEEHTSELQSQSNIVCRLLLEQKNDNKQSLPAV